MNVITTVKLSLITALSLISSAAFAGSFTTPISVPEPGILSLMGIGIAAVLYLANKRKK